MKILFPSACIAVWALGGVALVAWWPTVFHLIHDWYLSQPHPDPASVMLISVVVCVVLGTAWITAGPIMLPWAAGRIVEELRRKRGGA